MTPDQLYALLPAVHRRLDAEHGGRLYALLSVIAEQARVVQDDIEQLYDNWFIETCEDWVVPYLGDLVGYRILPGTAAALSDASPAHGLLAAAVPRREVADAIANRRRKGTLALLEDLASSVADWPGRAVEYRRLLAVTQPVRRYTDEDHDARRRLRHGRLVDLRRIDALDRIDGPFDELAHTVEVPRTGSARRSGRYGIPGVGLHVWRLRTHSLTRAPAFCVDRARSSYTFSVLGNDTALFTKPVPEPSPCHVADEMNVPAPIRRRALTERLHDYYGPFKSLCVWTGPDPDDDVVPLDRIVSADLSGWIYTPRDGQVAVDPVLGRIAFPEHTGPEQGVRVTYHHTSAGDFGGGEYPRPTNAPGPAAAHYRVGPGEEHQRISEAIERWHAEKRHRSASAEAVVEITGNDVHHDLTDIALDPGDHLTLAAAFGARPVLRPPERSEDRPSPLRITGTGRGEGPPPRVVLEGLMVAGHSVQVRGDVGRLAVRHCTFVPGWGLDAHGLPQAPGEAGLELIDTPVQVEVEHSILGTVVVSQDEAATEPVRISLSDTVLDATHRELPALTGPQGRPAHAVLTARRTTVIGSVRTRAVDLLENSLLDGEVRITLRSQGRVRFCWLPPDSATPRRLYCQPEHSGDPDRVVLKFAGTRYGTPDYVQLAGGCAEEIRRGADDGSEPGVLHDLFRPQREDNLRTRSAECAPAGCDAGVFFAT
ncbi:hypothetical protein [Kitasatospora purpeofusca]|uniref:Phage baseplate assembly protein n=1 Tax=Kitasatospora purpeofusca TaxID=67352 RepID=A0ABZ1UC25_9ACTN|nr:hypothetical protein [Kitasatospora purpeofusca]